jgi:hypothetical protein
MLRGEFEAAGESSAEELHEAYLATLRETVDRVGVETAAERTGVDETVLDALANGHSPELTLEVAMAVLALDEDRPDAETLRTEALDILLMGMTTAVLDVDAVAAGVDGDFDPKEIQQKIEGRYPMTLAEYARFHQFIESGR